MATLQELRNLLEQQRQKLNKDDDLEPDGHSQGNSTEEVTDQATWIGKITDTGNQAEDWLEFTNYMKTITTHGSEDIYMSYICSLYGKAIKAINADTHKDSLAYALLLINFADFQSSTSVEDARGILHHARNSVKRQSIVHIVSAEFEIRHGNAYKAKRLLEKAKALGAKPEDVLITAIRNMVNKEQKLLSDEDRKRITEPITAKENHGNPSSRLWPDPPPAHPANNVTTHRPLSDIKNVLKTSKSAEDLQSKAADLMSLKSENPHVYTDIIKRQGTGSLNSDSPVTFKTDSNHPSRTRSDSGGDEWDKADTIPFSLEAPPPTYSRTLRTYYSTPDCKKPGMLFSNRKPRNIGKPMRVKRSSLPQLKEGSTDDPDDSDFFKLEPLPETNIFDGAMVSNADEYKLSNEGERTLENRKPESVVQLDVDVHMQTDAEIRRKAQSMQIDNSKPTMLDTRLASCWGPTSDDLLDGGSFQFRKRTPTEPDGAGEASDHDSELSKDSGISTRPLDLKHSQNLTEEMPVALSLSQADQSILEPKMTGSTGTASTLKAFGSNISQMSTQTALEFVPTPSTPATNPAPTIPSQTSLPLPVMQASLPQPILPHPLIPSTQSGQPQAGIPQTGHCLSAMGPPAMAQPGSQMGFAQPGNTQPGMPVQRFQQPMGQPGYSQPGYPQPGMPQPAMPYNPTPNRQMEILTVNNTMYTVLRILGRGGSSKVYETLDEGNNLRAVKCVNLDSADEATINSYTNEIKLLERLQNSNKVIKLYNYEYREDCNMLYVVMERGDTDLASLFRKAKGEGIDSIMQKFYWKEMLKAVQVLHMEGIVHSDLKPANFVLVAGRLKLIDFGIANAIHQDMTSVIRDQQVGTLNYMSPEAIQDTCGGMQLDANGRIKQKIKIGVKSDVWSLGCILYNLVYSRTPFHHISNQGMKLHAITDPKCKIEFPESADPSLRQVLMKCLVRDPRERPSIEELLSYQY